MSLLHRPSGFLLVATGLSLSNPALASGGAEPAPRTTQPSTQHEASEPESTDARPSDGRRALGTLAAIVPGVIVHGSGSYVVGDAAAARQLLIMEGIGLGTAAASLAGLASTGAARSLSALFIGTAMAGGSMLFLTFAADVYHAASPPEGFGVPRRTPWFESHAGYAHVYDPTFAFRHFVQHGMRFQPGRFGIGFEAMAAPAQGNSRFHLAPRARLWEAADAAGPVLDGSHLEVVGGASLHRFDPEGFTTSTLELELRSRFDTTTFVPTIRGAFTEFSLGHAWRETRFSDFGVASWDTLLLGGFGFGMYLGSAEGPGGELTLYYDHRHDDFAAGFKAPGLGSGTIGHFGLRSHYYFDEHFGVSGRAEVGSAWVLGVGLTFRMVRGPRLRFW